MTIDTYEIGTIAKTDVSIFYIEDLVDKKALNEIKTKVSELDIKYFIHPQIIADEFQPPIAGLFPMTKETERFDVLVSDLLQGKVVIIADNTPLALIAPVLFWGFFQTQDDYFGRNGKLINRFVRLGSLFITMYLPALYLIVHKFYLDDIESKKITKLFEHNEIMHPLFEMIFILLLFRVAVDSSLRVYQNVAFLIAVLVTLILGEASIAVKILNPTELVVASLAHVCILLISVKGLTPLAISARLTFMIVGWYFGLNGLIIASTLLFIWGASLRPFGIPYFSPLIPFKHHEFKDTFWRSNLKKIVNSKHGYRKD